MTGPRPAGRPWTLTDDDMLRKLLTSGMKQRLIAQKMKRSIRAIETRIYLVKKAAKASPANCGTEKLKGDGSKRIYPPVPKQSVAWSSLGLKTKK
jgi:hypothetical protein